MKKYWILAVSLIIGAVIRLWMLSDIPNGLTWDEAAIGYNAYSILKTGRDEHGAFLPVVFKSFGDYKPGFYIYLTIPAVALFGLNEFAVRFPSVLAGLFAIFGIYLLVKEIFLDSDKDINSSRVETLSQLSAFALAVTPWHVHFSRGAWEVNVFSTFTIFAIYYFLRFLKGRQAIYPSLLFACLSLAMYQAAKLLTPLIFLLLIILYWSDFWKNFSKYFNPQGLLKISPFFLFGLWIFFGALFGSAGNRLNRLSIFNYRPEIKTDSAFFHNQKELSFRLVASRYLYHFSPEVLFYEGPVISERGHIPSLGVLHPLEIIWLILGLIFLASLKQKHSSTLILGLLLLAPIPASLTLAEFSTVRALFLSVPLAIISGLGLFYLLEKSRVIFLGLLGLYLFVTLYVFDVYFKHSQAVFAPEFNYGYKQAIQIIKDNPSQKIVFTDVYGQPYIYYVFYTQYDPALYQQNVDFTDGGVDVGKVGRVGNVEFHQFGADDMNTQKDTLFIGTEGNINTKYDIAGENVVLFKQIETPDKKIIFRILKTKP